MHCGQFGHNETADTENMQTSQYRDLLHLGLEPRTILQQSKSANHPATILLRSQWRYSLYSVSFPSYHPTPFTPPHLHHSGKTSSHIHCVSVHYQYLGPGDRCFIYKYSLFIVALTYTYCQGPSDYLHRVCKSKAGCTKI